SSDLNGCLTRAGKPRSVSLRRQTRGFFSYSAPHSCSTLSLGRRAKEQSRLNSSNRNARPNYVVLKPRRVAIALAAARNEPAGAVDNSDFSEKNDQPISYC